MKQSPESESDLKTESLLGITLKAELRLVIASLVLLGLISLLITLDPDNQEPVPPSLSTFNHPSVRFTDGNNPQGLYYTFHLPLSQILKGNYVFTIPFESSVPDSTGTFKAQGAVLAFSEGKTAEFCQMKFTVTEHLKIIMNDFYCQPIESSGKQTS
jgi:hypothetical protein